MPNALTYLGPAISGAGANLSQFGNDQEALRERLQQMIQMRLDKANEENRQNQELTLQQNADKRAQAEADKKAQDEKDQADFQKQIAEGNQVPAVPGLPMLGPASALQPEGSKTPETPVTSKPFTKDEIIQKALEKGVLPVDKFLEYTKTNQPSGDLGEYAQWLKEGNQGGIAQFLKAKAQATHIDVNPTNGRNQTSIRSSAETTRKGYEKAVNPYLSMEAIKKSNAWGTGVGDFNLLKLMATIDNGGKSPTDLDMKESAVKHGWGDVGNLAMGIISSSAKLTPQVREEMLSDARQQVQQKHDAYNETLQELHDEAVSNGFKPESLIIPGGTHHLIDSTLKANLNPENGPVKVSTKAERDALKPGTVYIGPDGNTATR